MRRLLHGGAAATLLAGTVAGTGIRPSAPPELLVPVSWLSQHLKDRDVVILQVSRPAEYAKGHIAGARLIDMGGTANLEADASRGAKMDMNALPTEAELHGKLQGLGISDGSHVVVVFGEPGLVMATRTIFMLRYAGVENVSLLDGGLPAWQRGGYPVTTATPTVTPGYYTGHIQPAFGVDYAYVQAHLHTPHFRIIDAREPVYYNATTGDGSMAAGHIPGAGNIPFSSLVDDAGLVRARNALEASFRAAGVQPGDTVIAYCHVGLQATAVVFSARTLGIPVKMYVGSFHDWTAHRLATEVSKP
jgi:thiosulfate/3-mercaptopyruvate sulfurtransferase